MKSFVCESCAQSYTKWIGKCPNCNSWNTIVEEVRMTKDFAHITPVGGSGDIDYEKIITQPLEMYQLNKIQAVDLDRIDSGMQEINSVLGGGFVFGSAILIGGDPGIGKSTLLLQIVAKMSQKGHGVVYASGEESSAQIAIRAERLGVHDTNISIASSGSVVSILKEVAKIKPTFLVIDSIQTMFMSNVEANPGTVAQIRASALEIIGFCKNRNIVAILVGHVTKEGQIAGPKLLEHMVDVVVYFEGEDTKQFRILRSIKNRFGNANEIGIFAMGSKGLSEITNPSAFFLSKDSMKLGAVIFVAIEGTRPVVTEVEALISQSYLPSPRRAVVGWDNNRLAMILAILQTHCKISMHDKDVYLSMAGGFKTIDPANDLAVAISLIRAFKKRDHNNSIVAIGEISLSGQIRNITWIDIRVKEAIKLGYTNFILPKGDKIEEIFRNNTAISFKTVTTIQEVMALV